MLTLRISGRTLQSLNRLTLALRSVADSLEDRSPALKKIKERQIDRWAVNFEGEGRIYKKWPAISETWTIPERIRKGYGAGPILIRSFGTFASFVDQNEMGIVDEQAVTWNFRNEGGGARGGAYPVSHHTGYTTSLGTVVPARVLWELDDKDEDAAERIMEQYVNSVIRRFF